MQVLRSQDTELVIWTDAESGFEYRGRFSAARIDGALSSGFDGDVGGDFQCEPDTQFSVSRQDTEFEEERFLPPGAQERIVEAEPEPEPESKPRPTPQSMVAPAYPIDAMDQELEGQVVVCFYVDRQGRVLEPLVMESSHQIFEAAVLKALSRSVYRPAEGDDQPARTHVCRTYKFWLD